MARLQYRLGPRRACGIALGRGALAVRLQQCSPAQPRGSAPSGRPCGPHASAPSVHPQMRVRISSIGKSWVRALSIWRQKTPPDGHMPNPKSLDGRNPNPECLATGPPRRPASPPTRRAVGVLPSCRHPTILPAPRRPTACRQPAAAPTASRRVPTPSLSRCRPRAIPPMPHRGPPARLIVSDPPARQPASPDAQPRADAPPASPCRRVRPLPARARLAKLSRNFLLHKAGEVRYYLPRCMSEWRNWQTR